MGSNPIGVTYFFSFSVWAHFLSTVIAQKVLFEIFIQHFSLPHTYEILRSVFVSLTVKLSITTHDQKARLFLNVGSPLGLIQRNPVNTATNGSDKFGRINEVAVLTGWPY